jgi:hypothetical protein
MPEISEMILAICENPIANKADVKNKVIIKDWGQSMILPNPDSGAQNRTANEQILILSDRFFSDFVINYKPIVKSLFF